MLTPLGNSPSIRTVATCFSLGTRIVYFSRAPCVDSAGRILMCANAAWLNIHVIAVARDTRMRHRKRCVTSSSMLLLRSLWRRKLHEHIRNVFPLRDQEAVRDSGGDVNHVAGAERVPFTSVDARADVLTGACARFPIDHRTSE